MGNIVVALIGKGRFLKPNDMLKWFMPSHHPIGPSRPNHNWQLLTAVLAICACGIIMIWIWGRGWIEASSRAALSEIGISARAPTVASIGIGGITFGPLKTEGKDGISAESITFGWTFGGLLKGRVDQVTVDRLDLHLLVDADGMSVRGLPQSKAAGTAFLPVSTIALTNANVSLATSGGEAKFQIDLTANQDADGRIAGNLAIQGNFASKDSAPIAFNAHVPDWRLTIAAGRLDVASASIDLTDQKIQLERIAGSLLLADNSIDLALTSQVKDVGLQPRFVPIALTIKAGRQGDLLKVKATAADAHNILNGQAEGTYQLSRGTGSGSLRVEPINFQPDGVQPRDLFPLLAANLGPTSGRIAIEGSFIRQQQQSDILAKVSLDNIAVANDRADLTHLTGILSFQSILPLQSAGAQHLTGSLALVPIPPAPFEITGALIGGNQISIERAIVHLAGGTLSLRDMLLAQGKPVSTRLEIEAIDLGTTLTLIGIDGLSGSGILDGQIPLNIDPSGVTIHQGKLAARGPGTVKYIGSALSGDSAPVVGTAQDSVSLLRQALSDFHYQSLSLGLERGVTGDGSLAIGLTGANPALLENYPFALNVRLDANFDRLANVLSSGYAAAGELLKQAPRP
jgi:hypothetical protein